MKTIVIYATKHGAAGEIAGRIADKTDAAVIHDLKQGTPSLEEFDCVIIGSSVYAGMIRKEAKVFLSQNKNALQGKKLGLFLSGLEASGQKTYFDNNFPHDVLRAAKTAEFLGGIFDPGKSGIIERFIMKMAAKKAGYGAGYVNTIDDSKIEQFAKAVKS